MEEQPEEEEGAEGGEEEGEPIENEYDQEIDE